MEEEKKNKQLSNLVRNYKELGGKEFFSRWKKGIEGITPLQQVRSSMTGSWIVLGGMIAGLIVNGYYGIWWLFTILIGSLLIFGMSFIATYQKYLALKRIEDMIREDHDQKVKGGLDNDVNEPKSTA